MKAQINFSKSHSENYENHNLATYTNTFEDYYGMYAGFLMGRTGSKLPMLMDSYQPRAIKNVGLNADYNVTTNNPIGVLFSPSSGITNIKIIDLTTNSILSTFSIYSSYIQIYESYRLVISKIHMHQVGILNMTDTVGSVFDAVITPSSFNWLLNGNSLAEVAVPDCDKQLNVDGRVGIDAYLFGSLGSSFKPTDINDMRHSSTIFVTSTTYTCTIPANVVIGVQNGNYGQTITFQYVNPNTGVVTVVASTYVGMHEISVITIDLPVTRIISSNHGFVITYGGSSTLDQSCFVRVNGSTTNRTFRFSISGFIEAMPRESYLRDIPMYIPDFVLNSDIACMALNHIGKKIHSSDTSREYAGMFMDSLRYLWNMLKPYAGKGLKALGEYVENSGTENIYEKMKHIPEKEFTEKKAGYIVDIEPTHNSNSKQMGYNTKKREYHYAMMRKEDMTQTARPIIENPSNDEEDKKKFKDENDLKESVPYTKLWLYAGQPILCNQLLTNDPEDGSPLVHILKPQAEIQIIMKANNWQYCMFHENNNLGRPNVERSFFDGFHMAGLHPTFELETDKFKLMENDPNRSGRSVNKLGDIAEGSFSYVFFPTVKKSETSDKLEAVEHILYCTTGPIKSGNDYNTDSDKQFYFDRNIYTTELGLVAHFATNTCNVKFDTPLYFTTDGDAGIFGDSIHAAIYVLCSGFSGGCFVTGGLKTDGDGGFIGWSDMDENILKTKEKLAKRGLPLYSFTEKGTDRISRIMFKEADRETYRFGTLDAMMGFLTLSNQKKGYKYNLKEYFSQEKDLDAILRKFDKEQLQCMLYDTDIPMDETLVLCNKMGVIPNIKTIQKTYGVKDNSTLKIAEDRLKKRLSELPNDNYRQVLSLEVSGTPVYLPAEELYDDFNKLFTLKRNGGLVIIKDPLIDDMEPLYYFKIKKLEGPIRALFSRKILKISEWREREVAQPFKGSIDTVEVLTIKKFLANNPDKDFSTYKQEVKNVQISEYSRSRSKENRHQNKFMENERPNLNVNNNIKTIPRNQTERVAEPRDDPTELKLLKQIVDDPEMIKNFLAMLGKGRQNELNREDNRTSTLPIPDFKNNLIDINPNTSNRGIPGLNTNTMKKVPTRRAFSNDDEEPDLNY